MCCFTAFLFGFTVLVCCLGVVLLVLLVELAWMSCLCWIFGCLFCFECDWFCCFVSVCFVAVTCGMVVLCWGSFCFWLLLSCLATCCLFNSVVYICAFVLYCNCVYDLLLLLWFLYICCFAVCFVFVFICVLLWFDVDLFFGLFVCLIVTLICWVWIGWLVYLVWCC